MAAILKQMMTDYADIFRSPDTIMGSVHHRE